MPKTDAEHLDELREWRDALLAELKAPGQRSAFGGLPNSNVGMRLDRMGGRAQLLAELKLVEQQIAGLEASTEDGPFMRESRGVY